MSDDVGNELPEPQFPTATWAQEGYRASEVDAFVGRLRKSVGEARPTMAPYEVVDERFKVTRVGRRYSLRPVDEYLDAGQEVLRKRLGYEPVTTRGGQAAEPRHAHTGWIYLLALVLVAIMVLFVLTQL